MKINFAKYFNETNIDNVEKEMQEHLPELFAQDIVIENSNERMKIHDYIDSLNNRKIMEHFSEYDNLKYKDTLFFCWLAYTIGFKKGKNDKK